MGMPITVCVCDKNITSKDIAEIFSYFHHIDKKFSTYKNESEISKINRGQLKEEDYSKEMKKIFELSEKTKKETKGYFDIKFKNKIDPSGIVKGFAIWEASKILKNKGYKNFYIEAGGDIQVFGNNQEGNTWKVGIKNPFNVKEVIKVLNLTNKGIATSGTYIKGKHIYNPKSKKFADEIASITVMGKNIYEADRFATAAFAMGEKGINFISSLKGFEGYMIKKDKKAVFTKGFRKYAENN